jgi:hypothetical protein
MSADQSASEPLRAAGPAAPARPAPTSEPGPGEQVPAAPALPEPDMPPPLHPEAPGHERDQLIAAAGRDDAGDRNVPGAIQDDTGQDSGGQDGASQDSADQVHALGDEEQPSDEGEPA